MAFAALFLVAPALPAVASSTAPTSLCSTDSATLRVVLDSGAAHRISQRNGLLMLNGEPCSPALSVLDSVSVSDTSGHDAALTIDVPAGGFRGAGSEQLSWVVGLADGDDGLALQGTGGPNRIKLFAHGADLNAGSSVDLLTKSVESIELRGGAGNDRLRAAAGSGAFSRSGSGSDAISVAGTSIGSYPTARMFGGAGDDTLNGDGNVNVIWAGPGNDKIFAKGGDDEIQGGEGNDELYGGDGDDLLNGGPDNDLEFGGGNNDLFQQAPQDVYTSATPVSIPDVGKALSSLTVPETTASVVDVNVRVYIDHPRTEDLWVTLIAPNNNRVRLAERRASGTSFNGTQFDSEAFTNIKSASPTDLSGRLHPEWSMELVQAQNPTGQWTLWVEDKVGGSVGTIRGWELELGMPTDTGDGADTISGGNATNDLLVYSQRTQGVTASLNTPSGGPADDGQALEGDSLGTPCPGNPNTTPPTPPPPDCSDLEWVYGGSGDDSLTGTDVANDLRGAPGADTITALGGNDQLRGANGQDNISGGGGNDVIHGQGNPDVLDGGVGFDRAIYGYSPVGLIIDISDPALGTSEDGAGNDDDMLSFIENITGTGSADDITGTDGIANVFLGAGGNDFMDGGTGNGIDNLDGAGGTDTCLNAEITSGCESTG